MVFAHIQYPIIDLRPFLKGEFKREIPAFPLPKADSWLRNFGHVRDRSTDTSPYFVGESRVCDAHNAVKFVDLPLLSGMERYDIDDEDDFDDIEDGDCSGEPLFDKVCRFRRFRSDGGMKSCFEIGLENHYFENDSFTFFHEQLEKIEVAVKSCNEERKVMANLSSLGIPVCKLYEDSTGINRLPVKKAVYSGKPTYVYIDFSSELYNDDRVTTHYEFERMRVGVKHYEDYRGIVWILHPWGYHYDRKLLASIRRAILAVALEKESLVAAYSFLLSNARNECVDKEKVLSYIKRTQEKLLRQIRFEIPQRPIVDVVFNMDFEDNKGFYYDVVKLICKFGDRYLVNEFNKLFVGLEFGEWRARIIEALGRTQDMESRKRLKQLRDICINGDRDGFWDFIYRFRLDVISLNILSNFMTNYLHVLFASVNL